MRRMLASIGVVAGVLLATSAVAPATAGESDLDALSRLNTGAAVAEMEDGLRAYASANDISFAEAQDRALAEATRSVVGSQSLEAVGLGVLSSLFGSTTTVTVEALGSARHVGDVFVAPASTLGLQHGHTGIYVDRDTVVEALAGTKSRAVSAATRLVPVGTVKQSIGVSQKQRDAAARYAATSLQGLEYNANFAVNRVLDTATVNCSQLVWAAYLRGAGVDIDGNGGLGVYPYDITSSDLATTYATLE